MEFTDNLEEAERKDKFRTKVMKYVLYKKRTVSEVREKFKNSDDADLLDETIDFLKDYNYLNDEIYIERYFEECKSLKNLSVREFKIKLMQKNVDKEILDSFFSRHEDELYEYEFNSVKNLIMKKSKDMDLKDIKNYLYKKGYLQESINSAINDNN